MAWMSAFYARTFEAPLDMQNALFMMLSNGRYDRISLSCI